MTKKKTYGMWLIILIFVAWGLSSLFIGIFSIINPYSVINFFLQSGFGDILGINPITGQPLFDILPLLGFLYILLGILLVTDVFGLLTYKEWGWIITALISVVLMIFIIGIFFLWVLDGEETKLAYNQA